jgi:NhaC family Na+:H+ antiporter
MALIIGMIITFCFLVYSVVNGIFVGLPLTAGFLIFAGIART